MASFKKTLKKAAGVIVNPVQSVVNKVADKVDKSGTFSGINNMLTGADPFKAKDQWSELINPTIPDLAAEAEREAAERAARLQAGTNKITDTFGAQFNPAYYNNLRSQFEAMHRPDMNRKFQEAQSSMLFNLARQGLAGGGQASNTANRNFAGLDQKKGAAELAIQRNADNVVNTRKNAVLNARNQILGQMNESGDVGTALNSAKQSIDANTAAPQYNPIGDLFSTAGQGLMTYNQNKAMKAQDSAMQNGMDGTW